MNPVMRQRKAYWIGGAVAGFLGVALVRLAPPGMAVAAGYVLVTAGIGILAAATRRKPSEAFITVEKGAGDTVQNDRTP